MTQKSRLDTAMQDRPAAGEWYRSPLALVAGIILFLGALALIVLSVTGGDESASDAGDDVALESEAPSDDAPAENADASASAPIVGFGGDGIPEVDDVALVGDPLPRLEDPSNDPAVGTVAPQITATSLATGQSITLEPGRARVIAFLAHWCPHCQAELPELVDYLADNELPPNTEFVAISTAVDQGNGNYPPSEWFNREGFAAPVLVDDADGTLLNGMGFGGFPAFVAIDASGVVVARAGGNIGQSGFDALFANFASAEAG